MIYKNIILCNEKRSLRLVPRRQKKIQSDKGVLSIFATPNCENYLAEVAQLVRAQDS